MLSNSFTRLSIKGIPPTSPRSELRSPRSELTSPSLLAASGRLYGTKPLLGKPIGVMPIGGTQANTYIKAIGEKNDVIAYARKAWDKVAKGAALVRETSSDRPTNLAEHPHVFITDKIEDFFGTSFVINAAPAHAVAELNAGLPPNTCVLEVQNGIKLYDEERRDLKIEHGISTFVSSPGPVGSGTTYTKGGKLEVGKENPFIEHIIDALGKQDVFKLVVVDNIQVVKWKKIAINCALNAPSTIFGTKLGELLERAKTDIRYAKLIGGIIKEVCDVQQAKMNYSDQGKSLEVTYEVIKNLPHHPTSMQNAFRTGATLELPVLNQGVQTLGRRIQIPTPLNDKIVEIMAKYEQLQPKGKDADPKFHENNPDFVAACTEELLAAADKLY